MKSDIHKCKKLGSSTVVWLFVLIFAFVLCSCTRTKVTWDVSSVPELSKAKVSLYIENSGSMDGYMIDGSSFKDAVFGYITAVNKYVGKTEFYFINTSILPDRIPLEDLYRSFNVASFSKAGGNRGHTDLSKMIKKILSRTDDHTVSVFVSDCILDLPQGPARDYFINNQISTQAIVENKLKENRNLSFVVYRMMSRFSGYFYNSGGTKKIDADRPYYIMVVGPWQLVSSITRKVPVENVPGAKLTVQTSFYPEHQPVMTITNVNGNEYKDGVCTLLPDRQKARFRIKLLADMSSVPLDGKELTDVSTYRITNKNLKIEYIERIKDAGSPYTHIITLSVPTQVRPSDFTIYIPRRKAPIWISQANDDTGIFIGRKTTGIKYFLNGIGAAYGNDNNIAEFRFSIKRQI